MFINRATIAKAWGLWEAMSAFEIEEEEDETYVTHTIKRPIL